ncbi:GNAT family N-acetyltransferase [Paenibacillus herberti]|uniref:N-acetyltransferase domain-containing protein n=1 Tax=Paenibacillus herberti TaxID=1619309 RepID=A0A229NYB4_9BACL|nr:GNAT family protein [Paenibacillus herberti]OXM14827.1 hypothetical protein CGZ75_18335 [Paenibacillus herberti]
MGYVDLASIKGNTAEIGVAIGESGLWGKGIGVSATKLWMDYASEKLGITVFYAEAHESNIRSIKMLEKSGFKELSRTGMEVYRGEECRLIQFVLQ